MSWNYLQTDDRDDYFETLGKRKKKGKKKIIVDKTKRPGREIEVDQFLPPKRKPVCRGV